MMTRKAMESAIQGRIPFAINLTDGKSYPVQDKYSIALMGETHVIGLENALPRMLPLRAISGISPLDSPSID